MTQPVNFRLLRVTGATARPSVPATGTTGRQQGTAAPVPVAQLTKLARALASGRPPADNARIAQIRQAIATNAYRVDAQEIAEAMLRHFGWTGT